MAGRGALDALRVELARSGDGRGVLLLPVDAMVARLAGGFSQVAKPESVLRAVAGMLADPDAVNLGDLGDISDLPGLRSTLAASLTRAWRAGLDVGELAASHPRLAAMARIEAAVLAALPPGELHPAALAARALESIAHAPAVLGSVEFRYLPDVDPCWREVVRELPRHVPTVWDAGPFPMPGWLEGSVIEIRTAAPRSPALRTASCATARHEVVEAVRWARGLMASGQAGPQDIAFAAVATGEFDDFIQAAADETLLPIHFSHGRSAMETPDGQTAAALADVLLRGLSQERIRRLVARLRSPGSAFAPLPDDWTRLLPRGAPLTTVKRWQAALSGPGAQTVADILLPAIEVLGKGPSAAAEAGSLLRGPALALWRRALDQAPGAAVERELRKLRMADETDPAAAIAWTPAAALASCPRPHVWLFGLNAGAWPRASAEDPLLPERLLGGRHLVETSITEADRTAFRAVEASTAGSVVRSFSRRDATGRLLGISPLVAGAATEHLYRTRVPEHAMSEADRLMARESEFAATPGALAAHGCWTNWRSKDITVHDGLLPGADHPAIMAALARPQSAASLTLLLRNPLGWTWRHALGMTAPNLDDEPLELPANRVGELVHEVLDLAVRRLTMNGGSAVEDPARIAAAVLACAREVGDRWEAEEPVPPAMLWAKTLERAEVLALNAMLFAFEPMPGATSYSEVHFGVGRAPETACTHPWDATMAVPVPGTCLTISGRIDRLDLSADGLTARVVDYKTGTRYPDIVLRGGRELQRCLYAYAVDALLGGGRTVHAGLLFPGKTRDRPHEGVLDLLDDRGTVLDTLSEALAAAVDNVREGRALPGVAAGTRYADTGRKGNAKGESDAMIFALPVMPGVVLGPKKAAARAMLGDTIVQFWEHG